MYKVGLENYTVLGKHGAFDFEHEYEQPFTVSIWVELNSNRFDDDISKTFNYAELQNVVHEVIANSPPIRLMETMITKIFDKIRANNLVRKISIRIEKPQANLPNEGGLATVESEWPFEQEN